jgi:peptidoglycan-associated lipoprotein
MKSVRLMMAASLFALIAGCASRGGVESEPPAPVEERPAAAGAQADGDEATEGAQAGGIADGGGFAETELDDPASPLSQRVFYFDFDSNEIKPEYAAALAAHGRYLAARPEVRATVEGHTDQRGSQEYNLALGERRAEAVKRVLVLNGATAEQVQGVSYGEEKPAVEGSTESAWFQNRRAELVYQR